MRKESREWMLKAIEIDPKNKNAYYRPGWRTGRWRSALRDAGIGPGPDMYRGSRMPGHVRSCAGQLLPVIEDGFRMLQIALDLDPQFSDAMAYMNLLARLKAPLADTRGGSRQPDRAGGRVGPQGAAKRRKAMAASATATTRSTWTCRRRWRFRRRFRLLRPLRHRRRGDFGGMGIRRSNRDVRAGNPL